MNKPEPKKSRNEVQMELAKARFMGMKRGIKKPLSPEQMREQSLAQNTAIRAYAQANKFGTVQQSFLEHHAFEKSFMGFKVNFRNPKAGKSVAQLKQTA